MTEIDYLGPDAMTQAIFSAVASVVEAIGPAERRVTKSQIGFYRRRPFGAVWRPDLYLDGARPPLVLSVFLPRRDGSRRWKEVIEPKPGRFTHHLELHDPRDVDRQVLDWLREAWTSAA